VYVDAKKVFRSVTVTSSAVGSYAGTRQVIDTGWDEWFRGMVPRAATVPFGFISQGRVHQYFPFDSATFDFTLDAEPQFDQRMLQVINRVPGFVLPCDRLQGWRDVLTPNSTFTLAGTGRGFSQMPFLSPRPQTVGGLHVSFVLWRSPFSLRTIIGDQVKTFPTLFDCFILTICMAMLVSLLFLWTVRRRTTQTDSVNRLERRRAEEKKTKERKN
jgi:hypothetical protein